MDQYRTELLRDAQLMEVIASGAAVTICDEPAIGWRSEALIINGDLHHRRLPSCPSALDGERLGC